MDDTYDDDDIIAEEASSGTGIALIALFAFVLLMLVLLFRAELGIPLPDVAIDQPDGIPEGAQSVNDQRAASPAPAAPR